MKSLVARETTGLISPLKNFLLPICAAKPDVLNSYLLATVFQCFGEVLAPHLLFAFRANLASGSVSLSIRPRLHRYGSLDDPYHKWCGLAFCLHYS